MTGLHEALREHAPDYEVPLNEGMVVRDVGSVSQGVEVHIPSFGRTEVFGPMPWEPRVFQGNCGATGCTGEAHIVYPQRGDRCLVVFTEEGHAWMVAYWPYDAPEKEEFE